MKKWIALLLLSMVLLSGCGVLDFYNATKVWKGVKFSSGSFNLFTVEFISNKSE